MRLLRHKQEARDEVERLRRSGARLGLVPTMGALHAGHLSLVQRLQPHCDVLLASVFVNPLQFGPGEDLERYPRDLQGDLRKFEQAGVDMVFAPDAAEMLGRDGLTSVHVERLGDGLCGVRRPGHFRGVTTIVTKLFHVLQPHVAVFGLKDAQQAIVLRRMVGDLDFPVQLLYGRIVRDPDGLALSSRNAYLTAEQRTEALLLQQSLAAARRCLQEGERQGAVLEHTMQAVLQSGHQLQVDYVACVDIETLQPLALVQDRALIAVGARVGDTHLIDNVIVALRADGIEDVDIDGNGLDPADEVRRDARLQGR